MRPVIARIANPIRLPSALLLGMFLMSVAALIGWEIDSPLLKAIVPGFPAMNPVVAICFVGLTAAFAILNWGPKVPGWVLVALSVCIAGIAGERILLTLCHVDKAWDTLLFSTKLEGEIHPNRMTWPVAWCVLGMGLEVFSIAKFGRYGRCAAQFIALAITGVGLMVANTFAFAVLTGQRAGSDAPTSLQTALVFVLHGICVLALTANDGVGRVIMANTFGAKLSRRLLAALLVIPPFFGWLTHTGMAFDLYGTHDEQALLATILTGAFAVTVWFGTREINKSEELASHAEGSLHKSRRLLSQVIDSVPNLIYVKDREGRFRLANAAGASVYGTSPELLLGRREQEFHRDGAESNEADRATIKTGKEAFVPEECVTDAAGVEHWLQTVKRPITNEDGEVVLLRISTDITDLKIAAERLEAAKAEAERANNAKSHFLSRMSHELRTPLNAVIGFSQLLQMESPRPEQATCIELINKAGKHLLGLINEILDISRIEAGKMVVLCESVDLKCVADQVLEFAGPLAAERGIALSCTESPNTWVHADRKRLLQILLNLVSNAIKYNREGGSAQLSWNVEGNRVIIEVRDSGPGIPVLLQAKLFTPFERLAADQGAADGTGLGLALSLGFAELMGGRLTLASSSDSGSVFHLNLPIGEAAEEPYSASSDAGSPPILNIDRPLTVLAFEDNEANIQLLEKIFSLRPNVELLLAGRADEGLDLARRRRPDLIVLDIHLPDQTGTWVLEQLRKVDGSAVPVLVVTADAVGAEKQSLEGLGISGYLTKPLDVIEFLSAFDECLNLREAA